MITVILHDKDQAKTAMAHAYRKAVPMLTDGKKVVVKITEQTRSEEQNRLLHSRINDVAKQVEWAGQKRSTEVFKRLLMAAFLRARGDSVEILPALDGQGVDLIFERTSKLSRAMCAEFSEYIMAWGTEQNVVWCQASLGRYWQE